MRKWIAVAMLAGTAFAPVTLAETSPRESFFAFQRVLEGARDMSDVLPYMSQQARADWATLPQSPDVSDRVFALMRYMGRVQNGVVVKEVIRGASADLVVEGTGSDLIQGRAVKVQTLVVLREESGQWKIERMDSQALAR